MARGAIRKSKLRSGRLVRRIRRLLPIRHVAGQACRRKPQIISNCGVLVTLLALDYGVRTKQRKSIEVLLNRLDRDLPALNSVALGALAAELSAVNVGVTISAVLANVSENRFGVASRAG